MILLRHGQSEFNLVYGATRQDPGIRDPRLTVDGRRQAREAAERLADHGIQRLIASPYTRALETAEIVAELLAVPISVEPLVGERVAFSCDIGSSPAALKARWPHLDLGHLAESWWPEPEESDASLAQRCGRFRAAIAMLADWRRIAVITHWGFIRCLTGVAVQNCEMLRIDPHRPLSEALPVAAGPDRLG